MKKIALSILLGFSTILAYSQNVGINTDGSSPDPSAMLDIKSTDKGILIPRMDSTIRQGIASPATGLLVFDTDTESFWYFASSSWQELIQKDDKDWLVEKTTNTPTSLNDDIYHMGHVAIGIDSSDHPLNIAGNSDIMINVVSSFSPSSLSQAIGTSHTLTGGGFGNKYGTYQLLTGSGNGDRFGSYNELRTSDHGKLYGSYQEVAGLGDDAHYGSYNNITGAGMGEQWGSFQSISNSGDGTHYGSYNTLIGNGNGKQYGTRQTIFNEGDGRHYGLSTFLSGEGNGRRYGTHSTILGNGTGTKFASFQSVTTHGPATMYGTHTALGGSGGGDRYGTYQQITASGNGIHYGTYNYLGASGDSTRYGTYSRLLGEGSGNHYGAYLKLEGVGPGNQFGTYHDISNSGNNPHYGSYNLLSGVGSGDQHGAMHEISNSGSGVHYGTRNLLTGTGTGVKYGSKQDLVIFGGNTSYGSYNGISGTGSAILYGSYQNIFNSGDGAHYGSFNSVSGTGAGNTYGSLQKVSNSGSGDHYGSYNNMIGNATGLQYGSYQNISVSGSADHYGTYNIVDGNGSGNHHATYNLLSGNGAGIHYGSYNVVSSTGTGAHYAGYFSATGGSNDFAAVFDEGNVVINESGGDYDFRVESDANTHILFVDASTNNVGIGTAIPTSDLEILGTDNTDAIEFDGGKVRLRHHFDLISSDRDFLRILIDADNNQTNADFAIYKDVSASTGQTASIRFHLEGNNSWINGGGNLGIGTNTPGTALSVNGPARASFDNTETDYVEIKHGGFNGIVNTVGDGLLLFQHDGATKMAIRDDGNVGIGNGNPSHPLQMGSGAHVTAGGVWTNASDISKKNDIKDLEYGLNEILQAKPKQYQYKADDSHSIGFIAQEMEKIMPEVVSGKEGDKGIAYGLLTAVLVNAIQEQQEIIDELLVRIGELEKG